jgi:hypothetical protein
MTGCVMGFVVIFNKESARSGITSKHSLNLLLASASPNLELKMDLKRHDVFHLEDFNNRYYN